MAYGCLYESFSYNMKGLSKRSAFIIDESEIVRYTEILENSGDVPNFAAIGECLIQSK